MIDLNKLVEIASVYDAEKNEKILLDGVKKYENYIDRKLVENAKCGKRSLTIYFNIHNFVDFNSIMVNYFNYKNNRYNIEAEAADDGTRDFVITDALLKEFCDVVSKLDDSMLNRFIVNPSEFDKFTAELINCTIKNIKMRIEF